MGKNNLIKKFSTGLGILALSGIIGSGVCYSKETDSKGYQIPDLSQAEILSIRYDDLTDKIAGKETCVEHYRLKNPNSGNNNWDVHKVSINKKVFLYSIEDFKTGEFYGLADLDGDGVFETKYNEDDLIFTDKSQDEFPVKKDLPPEWVLK